jgi:pilus assembly protein CpaB
VPAGQVAVSLSLSDPGRVGTFVTPGSHIVLFDTYTPVASSSANANATAAPPRWSTRSWSD